MKSFDKIDFSVSQCAAELDEFKGLLASKDELDETEIATFFKGRRHLSAFIGSLNSAIGAFDRVAYELDLFGDFSCDLATGDATQRVYSLVEFEDASKHSVFRRNGKKHAREWAPRFEHGFSQIVDWFWKLDDQRKTDAYRACFGDHDAHISAFLIVGRNKFIKEDERRRLNWRLDRIVIDSKHLICMTFDDLYEKLRRKMSSYQEMAKEPVKGAE